jgi:hypothetical protein
MTVHYSRFGLNTYCGVAYFRAHFPEDYPFHPVLQKSRAFRRLPPNLRQLAELSKSWSRRGTGPPPQGSPDAFGIEGWYDDQGYELDHGSGRRLTDEEIDAQWDALGDLGLDDFEVTDIPVPPGGFADPYTWEEPEVKDENLVDRSGLTKEQILSDIQSRGRAATAKEYGVPAQLETGASTDAELAHIILAMHGQPWSKYRGD